MHLMKINVVFLKIDSALDMLYWFLFFFFFTYRLFLKSLLEQRVCIFSFLYLLVANVMAAKLGGIISN